jgi:hypothetical protein
MKTIFSFMPLYVEAHSSGHFFCREVSKSCTESEAMKSVSISGGKGEGERERESYTEVNGYT